MIATTLAQQRPPTQAEPLTEEGTMSASVDDAVRRRIEGCPYRFAFDKLTWRYEDGTLTIQGCVPSFHLKQVLQELLRNIEGIRRIENSVDVVNSNGLSSDSPNTPR